MVCAVGAALLAPRLRPRSVAPNASSFRMTRAPCVLALERSSRPDDEQRSADPSWKAAGTYRNRVTAMLTQL
jgi:hypothetical protein